MVNNITTDKFSVYFHCSESDKEYLHEDNLLGFLSGLRHQGIFLKSDQDILAGDETKASREKMILESKIIVIIISQRWLDNDIIRGEILPILEKRYKENLIDIIPVIADDCDTFEFPWFNSLQFFPSPGLNIAIDYKENIQRIKLYKAIRQELIKKVNTLRNFEYKHKIQDIESTLKEARNFINIGQNKLARYILESTLKSKAGDEDIQHCQLLLETGNCQRKTGAQVAAYQNYLNILEISQKLKNKELQSIAYNCIGNIYREQGNLLRAINQYTKSKELLDENNLLAISNLNINVGATYRRIGDFKLAIALISSSSETIESMLKNKVYENDKPKIFRHLGIAYGMLSLCDISSNDNVSAFRHAEKGLELALLYDNYRGISFAKHRVAQVYLAENQPIIALPFLKEAYMAAREAEDIREVFAILLDIGNCHFQLEQFEDAERYFFSAMMSGVPTNDFFRIAQSHDWLGKLRIEKSIDSYYYFEVARRLFKLVSADWWSEKVNQTILKECHSIDPEIKKETNTRVCSYIEELLSESIITKKHFSLEIISEVLIS